MTTLPLTPEQSLIVHSSVDVLLVQAFGPLSSAWWAGSPVGCWEVIEVYAVLVPGCACVLV